MLRKATFGIVMVLMVAGMLTLTFSIQPVKAVDITPPTIDIISPQNSTYINPVPLNFTIDEPTSWIRYSVDAQSNVTIMGNVTLDPLALGSHNIILYANDTSGNIGSSAKIYFTVTFLTDMNLDGSVLIDDVLVAVQAFGSDPDHPRWNPQADVNGDEVVRVDDILAVALDFGKTL